MGVGVQGEAGGEVTRHAGGGLDVHAVLQRQGSEGMAPIMEKGQVFRQGLLKHVPKFLDVFRWGAAGMFFEGAVKMVHIGKAAFPRDLRYG